ncbi:hypothetical protein PF008_g8007 [Phytophthora fragariae]|uniref:Uncharacterized protein n=1 Tax=Phytophthora fragariae TaxID=53985 RepID=A0A6G0S1U2_9STRA|nr:hypothetical protein PF008_g8007 [Phytophthora fragariae]
MKVILLTYVLYVAFVSHCGDEAGGSVQATDAKLRASCSRCVLAVACMACMKVILLTYVLYVAYVSHSVGEAGGVQATDAKLRASCSR